ncbi:MAG: ABC transporter ATP-binding protein [Sedimentisphaerales bacterium]|nr:ABC transporter ATP-binding protein [Sedimentisphaerales bacterium]
MAVELAAVTVRYGHDMPPAIMDVSFCVPSGQRLALLGLNGSGKTTLLQAISGLLAFEGKITICGIELSSRTLGQVRSAIGMLFNVPEEQLLLPSVIDDVAFGAMARGLPRQQAYERAKTCLESLGISGLANLSIHACSHGQKLLVALAGILVCQPQVMLLDEPSAGLDPLAKRRLKSILAGLDATMLIASHDLDFVDGLCTRSILLDNGRIAHDGDLGYIRRLWGCRP